MANQSIFPAGETMRPHDQVRFCDPKSGLVYENLTVDRVIVKKRKAVLVGYFQGRKMKERVASFDDCVVTHRGSADVAGAAGR